MLGMQEYTDKSLLQQVGEGILNSNFMTKHKLQ